MSDIAAGAPCAPVLPPPEPPWLAYVGHWRTCAVTQSWECTFGGDPETDEAEAAMCTCGFSAMLAAYRAQNQRSGAPDE